MLQSDRNILDYNWHVSTVIHCQLSVRNDAQIRTDVVQQWYANAYMKSNNSVFFISSVATLAHTRVPSL